MKATLIFKDKYIYADSAIREIVIWRLSSADKERPHGLKYRLYYGFPGKCLVRYDNERGKGDHRHYENREMVYTFTTPEQLIQDFKTDINLIRGEDHE